MTVESMREYIAKMYDADKWRLRVQDMSDRQVIAVYKNMKRRGQKPAKKKKGAPVCEQLNMFDMLAN